MNRKNPPTQVQANKNRLEKVKQVQNEKKRQEIENMSNDQVVSQLKNKGLPVFGTHQQRIQRLKKASGISENNAKKPKSTLEEIDAISRRREERRRKMEEEKILKQEKKLENEANGKVCDVEFQIMIDEYRENLRKNVSYVTAEDMKIYVCVRKRPIFSKEEKNGEIDANTCVSPCVLVHEPKYKVDGITKYLVNHEFNFDNTFGEEETNDTVYSYTLKSLCPFILNNGTVTCFAYGQTGSGKTYTMKALQSNIVSDLFRLAKSGFQFTMSFYEIYGGRCMDLLNNKEKLRILEDGVGSIQIQGLVEKQASSVSEIQSLIEYGNSVRTTHATTSNEDSSRSHAICQISVAKGKQRGKLILVDLAGSERAQDCMSNNRQRRLEGAEINKSLLALKECIRALSTGEGHVPYRGSKLTLVLRDSFTGRNNKIVMLSCISPGHTSADHTLNTLRYADRLKDNSKDRRPVQEEYKAENYQSAQDEPEEDPVFQQEFNNFQKQVEALLEKEEELLNTHVDSIKQDASILTQEGNLIDSVQGEKCGEYDIDQYVQDLETLVKKKLNIYQNLFGKLQDFKKCLKDEEVTSNHITNTFKSFKK